MRCVRRWWCGCGCATSSRSGGCGRWGSGCRRCGVGSGSRCSVSSCGEGEAGEEEGGEGQGDGEAGGVPAHGDLRGWGQVPRLCRARRRSLTSSQSLGFRLPARLARTSGPGSCPPWRCFHEAQPEQRVPVLLPRGRSPQWVQRVPWVGIRGFLSDARAPGRCSGSGARSFWWRATRGTLTLCIARMVAVVGGCQASRVGVLSRWWPPLVGWRGLPPAPQGRQTPSRREGWGVNGARGASDLRFSLILTTARPWTPRGTRGAARRAADRLPTWGFRVSALLRVAGRGARGPPPEQGRGHSNWVN